MFCMDRRGLRACPIPHLHIERCSSIHKTGTVPSGFFTALPVWKAAQVVTKINAWSIVPISWSAAMAARHVCLFAVLAVVTYILVACPYILGTTVHGLQIELVCWCLCFDQRPERLLAANTFSKARWVGVAICSLTTTWLRDPET